MGGRKLCVKGCGKPARTRGMCPRHYEDNRRRIGWESTYVDAQPIRNHINALRAAGISNKRLCQLSGVSHNTGLETHRREAPRRPSPGHRIRDGSTVKAGLRRGRLRALVAAGYSRSDLCRRLGITVANGCKMFYDDYTHTHAATARRVRDLFDELQLTPGPSSRARNEGKRHGWSLPLDWDEDDIDKPDATTTRSDYTPPTRAELTAERREEVVQLAQRGLTNRQIANRLNVSLALVQADRVRTKVAS